MPLPVELPVDSRVFCDRPVALGWREPWKRLARLARKLQGGLGWRPGGSNVGKDDFVLAEVANFRRRFAAVHQHGVRPHLLTRGSNRVLHRAGIVGFNLHRALRSNELGRYTWNLSAEPRVFCRARLLNVAPRLHPQTGRDFVLRQEQQGGPCGLSELTEEKARVAGRER